MIEYAALKKQFDNCADIRFQTFEFPASNVMLITCEAMTDNHLFNEVVVPRLRMACQQKEHFDEAILIQKLHLPRLLKIEDLQEAVTNVFSGFVLIYIENLNILLCSNIENKPNRSPEESNLEVTIKGPRDNFIEDLGVNIALIRKRLPTNSLSVEKITLGTRSKTKLAILYFNDIADLSILKQLKNNSLKSIQMLF